jgi:dUTP pyrophosphatase
MSAYENNITIDNNNNYINNQQFYNVNLEYYFNELLTRHERIMHLQLKVVSEDNDLIQKYIENANNHNNNLANNIYPDAGFNLLVPTTTECYTNQINKIDFGVKCSATLISKNHMEMTGYYMYPRSSTGSKTLLRLANSVGIIDSGYRGNLMGCFDVANYSENNIQTVQQYSSIIQICAPSLVPIIVEIVEDLDEETERGEGGFGSTGH